MTIFTLMKRLLIILTFWFIFFVSVHNVSLHFCIMDSWWPSNACWSHFFCHCIFWNGKKYPFARVKNVIWSGKLFAIWGGKFNQINLWTCNLWTGQSVKQIKLYLPPQMAKSFPDQIFCHLYLCHNRRNACCRWWKSYFSCSISIREISKSSGEREGFSQWIVEIKDIARLLSLSVRNKWTYKKVVTINLHQIYSRYITHRSWYLKKDWTCKIACKSS